MESQAAPRAPRPETGLSRWPRAHIHQALRICYSVGAIGFILPVWLIQPRLLGVFIGFGALRLILFVPERLATSVFLDHLAAGRFWQALESPGVTAARQVQSLRRLVTDRSNRVLAEQSAAFLGCAVDAGRSDMIPVLRDFENTWGVPPAPGENDGLVRHLLVQGFRFTTTISPEYESEVVFEEAILWRDLWRKRLWQRLWELYPDENHVRLALRIYAAEWQALLAPIWAVAAILIATLLSHPGWLSPTARGLTFYFSGAALAASAFWLAFFLRPGAFNASLLAGDMDRAARWVLESVEGKHFLVSALGSANEKLRRQALRLLLWSDALFTANITLPEGMKSFVRRERGASQFAGRVQGCLVGSVVASAQRVWVSYRR